jgi:hypothetical protein
MANTEVTLGQKLKKKRRKRVKRFGKFVIRGLADFLGRQSLVGDMPIHDNKDFPFPRAFRRQLEGNPRRDRGDPQAPRSCALVPGSVARPDAHRQGQ